MRNRTLSVGIVAFLLALLGACAHAPRSDTCAELGAIGYCAQPTAGMAPFSTTRLVHLTHAQGRERLIVQLEVDEEGLRMAGLTPFGVRVLWISLDRDGRLDIESKAPMDARQILAGIQIADWPADRVRAGLRGATARLVESTSEAGATRQVLDGERVVFSARCEGARPLCRRAQLRYETLGVTLDIETLDPAPH